MKIAKQIEAIKIHNILYKLSLAEFSFAMIELHMLATEIFTHNNK